MIGTQFTLHMMVDLIISRFIGIDKFVAKFIEKFVKKFVGNYFIKYFRKYRAQVGLVCRLFREEIFRIQLWEPAIGLEEGGWRLAL